MPSCPNPVLGLKRPQLTPSGTCKYQQRDRTVWPKYLQRVSLSLTLMMLKVRIQISLLGRRHRSEGVSEAWPRSGFCRQRSRCWVTPKLRASDWLLKQKSIQSEAMNSSLPWVSETGLRSTNTCWNSNDWVTLNLTLWTALVSYRDYFAGDVVQVWERD